MSAGLFELVPVAFARVNGADGAALSARGATTARAGAGDYTVTVASYLGLDLLACWIGVNTEVISTFSSVVHTSDVAKQVLVENDASAATDSTFTFLGCRIDPQP